MQKILFEIRTIALLASLLIMPFVSSAFQSVSSDSAKIIAYPNNNALSQELEISKDTVKYNAEYFIAPGINSLKDLLEALPGFLITDDREIFAYGQPVTSFYINGTSVLFEKLDMVCASVSAADVEKVVVYDNTSDLEDDSGVSDMDSPEKAVDIIFRPKAPGKVYAGVKFDGGFGSGRFLYNSAGSVIGYGRGQQFGFFVTGADNLQIENETEEGIEGMLREYNGGVHYYTENLRKLEFKLGATYSSSHTEEDKVASRQSFFETSTLASETSDYCTLSKSRMGVSVRLNNKDNGKFYIEVTPDFFYTSSQMQSLFNTEVLDKGKLLNRSQTKGFMKSNELSHSTALYFSYKNLGKQGRTLIFDFCYNIDGRNSNNKEFVEMDYTSGEGSEVTDLLYDDHKNEFSYNANLAYAEPLGKNWALDLNIVSELATSQLDVNAYSPVENNIIFTPSFDDRACYSHFEELYSTASSSRYFVNGGRLLTQYKKDGTILQAGLYGQVLNNELTSRYAGVEQSTGGSEYIWDWSPFIKFSATGKKGRHIMVNYIGSSANLPAHLLLARADITDPTHISFGNVYLKPGFENTLNLYYNFNSSKKHNLMYLNLNIERKRRAVVDATWFDSDGVQYFVPVNSEKITRNFTLEYSFSNIPIDRGHNLILNLSLEAQRGEYYGYQAVGESNVIDFQKFDYWRFMTRFWGSRADGTDFYSGKTGFMESRTTTASIAWDLNFEYSLSNFTLMLGANAQRRIINYTFDTRANMNTWVVDPYIILEYETKWGLKFETELDYEMYKGYSEAYGEPGLMWNFHAMKRFGKFTVKASIDDILDDASYLHRTVTDNYVEESVARHLGRRIMVGAAFDF